jgi:hypothetical protein
MARRRPPAPLKPVSGPGTLSQRTDRTPQGAAASRGQPVRVAPGQTYGERQALEGQQAAAPLAAPGGIRTQRLAEAANAPVGPLADVFGPSGRPNEPITAGVPFGAGPGQPMVDAEDPDLLLQALFGVLPHPEIARLMLSGGIR